MKRKLTFIAALLTVTIMYGQLPQKISYQAVVRNSSNQLVASQAVGMVVSILKGSATGSVVYSETHSPTTNASGIITIEIGGGTPVVGTFSEIDWSSGIFFVKTETDPTGGTSYSVTGISQLLSVPYAFRADKAATAEKLSGPVDKLSVTGQTDNYEEALFEIKNKEGQTVFAVYNEGVRIYVDNGTAKGSKGGFAIGGFGSSKAEPQDLFIVNPDSIRAYVDAGAAGKGSKGGFAIGGFGSSKAGVQDYLVINPDSIRMYVNADPAVKGSKGGFSIGGFSTSKSTVQDLLVVNPDSIRAYIDTDTDSKGSKGGFAIGGFGSSKASAEEYLRVTRDSTRVYLNELSAKGKKGGFAIGGFAGSKSVPEDYLFLNSDSTRFFVRQLTEDYSSSFDIVGYDLTNQRRSLFQAGPDSINVQGVLNVENNLIVEGNVETTGEIQQVGTLTDISGNSYKTIKIGGQEWMVDNLKTTKYNDGSDIPNVPDAGSWSALGTGAYSDYNNDPANADVYGRLYNWHAVNTNMLCPDGWHVPTDFEWSELDMYLTNNGYGYIEGGPEIAKSISSTTLWAASAIPGSPGNTPETNNRTGFTGIPAGLRNATGSYVQMTFLARWWSISPGASFDAFFYGLNYDQGVSVYSTDAQVSGYSIRCIKGVYIP